MTTASLPHGHSAPSALRRIPFILAGLLALGAAPAYAATKPTIQGAAAAPAASALTQVAVASPDTAPMALPGQPEAMQTSAPSTTERIKTVLQRSFALLGTPYRWGGTSPENGFDCSGLVGYVFRTIGIDLPRVSRAMAHEGAPVTDRAALAEGDLVFFGRNGRTVDHVGIYIGEGKFVHAPRTGRDVTVSSLANGYWSQKYLQARRLAVGS